MSRWVTRHRAAAGVAVASAAVLAGVVVPGVAVAQEPLPAGCAPDPGAATVTCRYGPGDATFTPPAGVTSADVTIAGGAGGSGDASRTGGESLGGNGGVLAGRVTLTGAALTFRVGEAGTRATQGFGGAGGAGYGPGGAGAPGNYRPGGSGGGGGTGWLNGGTAVAVAGGGGGGGAGDEVGSPGGNGGAAGQPGASAGSGTAGVPGGGSGRDGGAGGGAEFAGGGGGGGGGMPGGGGATSVRDDRQVGGGAGGGNQAGGGLAVQSSTNPGPGYVTVVYTPAPVGPAPNVADLKVSVTAPATLRPGATGQVTLTVRNPGPGSAQRVVSGIALPKGLTVVSGGGGAVSRDRNAVGFYAPTIANGASVTYTITVRADQGARGSVRTSGGVYSTGTRDPRLADNAASATTRIG